MLRARGVSQSYGGDDVFRELSLGIEPGEVVAVIGPSGVGKTTLLRMLALSLEPDEGTVSFRGTDAWGVSEAERLGLRRHIGMVFQEASLFDATVARNVEYGLRIRRSWSDRLRTELDAALSSDRVADAVRGAFDLVGLSDHRFRRVLCSLVSSAGPAEAVYEALDVVGLTEKMDQHAESLSGGEAQRVSFARALAYEPEILLLDEPTSDLDPRNTAVLEEAIAEARKRGIGVVVATHDMHQAERVADRVAVLLDESITEVAPTEVVFEDPSDERTRKFISGELVY
jgi:tungstate transport system ATP-binding protein